MTEWLRRLAFCFGIALIICGPIGAVVWLRSSRNGFREVSFLGSNVLDTAKMCSLCGPPWPKFTGRPNVSFDIKYPAEVNVGDPFVIILKASKLLKDENHVLEFSNIAPRQMAEMRFRISTVDLTVQPSDYVNLTLSDPRTCDLLVKSGSPPPVPSASPHPVPLASLEDHSHDRVIPFPVASPGSFCGTVTWSAKGDAVGPSRVVVNSNLTSNIEATEDIVLDEPLPVLTIIVRPRWFTTLKRIAPVFSAFLGSLLTVPGILAYLEARRKRRKEEQIVQVVRDFPDRLRLDR